MFLEMPLLSLLIWLPILGACVIPFFRCQYRFQQARYLALFITLISFVSVWPALPRLQFTPSESTVR